VVSIFKCRHCLCDKSANPRLKGSQTHCGEASCQRARKAEWKRRKMEQDRDYRWTHCESNKTWRLNHPEYWREYRQKHPHKVKRNRLLQKLRRIKAQHPQQADSCQIAPIQPAVAKVDALFTKQLQAGSIFWLKPAVAKVDALLVEISSISVI
jgi:hypothetical protein